MAYIGTSPSNGVRRRFVYEATASQTSFSGSDENGVTLTYVDSLYLDVFQNGIKLKAGDDYTATTGTSVVLVQGASANDVVEMVAFDIFSVNDSVSAKDGGSFAGDIGITGNLTISGTVDGRDVATDGTKLDGVEASADVTDGANVGSSLTGFSTTTSFQGADIIPVYDTSASAWVKGTITNAALQGPAGADGAAGAAGTPSTTLNTVGSYGFLQVNNNTNHSPGVTLAGSSLRYGNANGTVIQSPVPSGTWRIMGYNNTTNNPAKTSLWVRTA